ncbi:hypothetical protein ATK30_0299 [Amycolatopsis echigonensis]|uniref:Uncharacterized protein n=1 Tax=Amycolatopsis echigonensis TaxID=2576905 RepID=A0A2N3X264_9PSEU|nr:hypothetical protein ATK30_0299 [Amycolatopsis niigatensis]
MTLLGVSRLVKGVREASIEDSGVTGGFGSGVREAVEALEDLFGAVGENSRDLAEIPGAQGCFSG